MGADERGAPRALAPWLIVAAIVFFGGQLLPLPGIDHEAFAALATQGGLLGLFNASAPTLAIIGPTAGSLVLIQLALLAGGALDRPTPRRIAFVVYVVWSAIQGFALALWAESLAADYWDVVPQPGWSFRILVTMSITAGGALLWWVFARIDRSRRAHGALFLALLVGVEASVEGGLAAGAGIASGEHTPLLAMIDLALPLALVAVAGALVMRPARWPTKLFGPVSLGSSWDALALPALVGLPFDVLAGGATLIAPEGASAGVGALRAFLTVAVGIGFAMFWLRRAPAPKGARSWAAPIVAGAILAVCAGAAFVGFASAGGIEAALTPGPLAGDSSYRIVLEAEDAFVAADGPAMVQRLEALGASATVESQDARRIALRIEGSGDVATVIDALQPRVLEMSFTEELDGDPLAGTFGITPVRAGYDSPRVRGWTGDCEDLEPFLMEPPAECEPALERSRDTDLEGSCTLHCLADEVILSGADIADARVDVSPEMGPSVSLELTPDAAEHFGEATGANLRRALAILVDGEVVSAPIVQSRIDGGRVQITLGAARDYETRAAEANRLATALRPGARISTRFTLAEQSF